MLFRAHTRQFKAQHRTPFLTHTKTYIITYEFRKHIFPTRKAYLSNAKKHTFQLEKTCFPKPRYLGASRKESDFTLLTRCHTKKKENRHKNDFGTAFAT